MTSTQQEVRRDARKPEIIIVHETVLQSILIDATTLVLFVALIGIGVVLDSSAMQWIGAIVGFLTISARAKTRCRFMSIDDARRRLDEIEQASQQEVRRRKGRGNA